MKLHIGAIESGQVALDDEDGEVTGWIDPKKAAHIVHCVNVHGQLVEALTDVDEWLCDDSYDLPEEVQEKVRAALSAAKEGK